MPQHDCHGCPRMEIFREMQKGSELFTTQKTSLQKLPENTHYSPPVNGRGAETFRWRPLLISPRKKNGIFLTRGSHESEGGAIVWIRCLVGVAGISFLENRPFRHPITSMIKRQSQTLRTNKNFPSTRRHLQKIGKRGVCFGLLKTEILTISAQCTLNAHSEKHQKKTPRLLLLYHKVCLRDSKQQSIERLDRERCTKS